MNKSSRWVTGALACLLLALGGCPGGQRSGTAVREPGQAAPAPSADSEPIAIWADPVLKGGIEALEREFGDELGAGLEIEYRELAELEGVSAESQPEVLLGTEQVIKKLLTSELIESSTARTFAGDLLVIATPADKPVIVTRVGDLPMVQFKAFGLGTKDTAVGYYGEQALISDGALGRIEEQIRRFSTTEELLEAIREGTIQLGMLFGSTVAQQPDLRISMTVPEDLHQDVRYMAVATTAGAGHSAVAELLRLLSEEPKVQEMLGGYGYLDRTTALIENR